MKVSALSYTVDVSWLSYIFRRSSLQIHCAAEQLIKDRHDAVRFEERTETGQKAQQKLQLAPRALVEGCLELLRGLRQYILRCL